MQNIFAFLLLILALSCGQQSAYDDNYPPEKPIDKPFPGGDDTFADVQPLIKKFCAECHSDAVFISNEKGFMASKASLRIQNKSMPPAYAKNIGQWTAAERERILKFVNDNK